MKKIKRMLRLTPLNEEVKRIEVKLYKNDYRDEKELIYLQNYLEGLKKAHDLVKIIR